MIGKQKSQLSLLDSAFNARKKRGRADKLLKKIDKFIDWNNLASIIKGMYKDTKRGWPSTPIIIALKCLILQYLYNLSDPVLEDALINPIPNDHPIYQCFFEFDEPSVLFPPMDEGSFEDILPLDGVWLNIRLIAVIPPSPYNPFVSVWSNYESDSHFENPRFRIAVNIVVFALIREGSIAKNFINTESLV